VGVFQDLLEIEKSCTIPDSLCLCYTVTFKDSEILERKSDIELSNYEPYSDKCALLSYGRPYLRENENGTVDTHPPITFLFKFDSFDAFQLSTVSSFDSSLLSKIKVGRNHTINSFSYNDPCLCILPVFISLLFGNNDNFLKDEISFEKLKKLAEKEQDMRIIHDIYRIGKNMYGYPSASIEVRYLEKMPIEPFHVILPYIVHHNDSYNERKFKDLYKADVSYYGEDEYSAHQDLPPGECHKLLRAEVEKVLKEMSQKKWVCKAFRCINENI